MKLLLTSAGIKNTSIHDALADLLGKPIAESSAPLYPHRDVRQTRVVLAGMEFIAGREPGTPMCELGRRSLGVLELTALPSSMKSNGPLGRGD